MQWKLNQLRREFGLSQKQMAKILGINEATYNRKEVGHFDFTAREMFILSDYFDRTLDDIFLPPNSIVNAK